MSGDSPWSVPIRLDEIPEGGKHVVMEPSADIRAALTKPVGVDAIERLKATVEIRRLGRDGVRVIGEVQATVRQTCVVSLAPMTNDIHEAIEVDFRPPRADKESNINEIEIEVDASDEAEPLIGNSIDLGQIATEFLTLGVDPYPRKPDAAFESPAAIEGAAHPFAALASLKAKGSKEPKT